MEEEKHLKPIDKEKVKLTTGSEDSAASSKLIEVEQDQLEKLISSTNRPWLLVPRIKCDVPRAERLLYRPNIILGSIFGIMMPFVLLHLGLAFHQYMNTYVNSGFAIAALLFLGGQFKFNRYFTYRFRNPFFC